MSQHAKPTLVRIFRSDNDFVANILVDDWETKGGWAEFTIPSTHPFANQLFDENVHWQLIVLDSEEIEWRLQQMNTTRLDPDVWRVRCRSRRSWLRSWMPDDEWAIDKHGVLQ